MGQALPISARFKLCLQYISLREKERMKVNVMSKSRNFIQRELSEPCVGFYLVGVGKPLKMFQTVILLGVAC